MIGKEIPYTDYDGLDHKKTFYFSISQTEFALLNNRLPGGFDAYIRRLQEDRDEEKILDLLMMFITEGYGIRESSDDFVKEDERGRKLGLRFKCSEACDNLIEELLSKPDAIWDFILGMLPKKAQEKARQGFNEAMAAEKDNITALPVATPDPIP